MKYNRFDESESVSEEHGSSRRYGTVLYAPLQQKTHQKLSQVDLRYIEFLFRFGI